MATNPYREARARRAGDDAELAPIARVGRLRRRSIRAAPAAAVAAAAGILGSALAASLAIPALGACPSIDPEVAAEGHVNAIERGLLSVRRPSRHVRGMWIPVLSPRAVWVEEGSTGPFIERTLASGYPYYRTCYLADDFSGGDLTVGFVVGADGQLTDVRDEGSTVDKEVVDCMVTWLAGTRLVPAAEPPMHAVYWLRLSPSGFTDPIVL